MAKHYTCDRCGAPCSGGTRSQALVTVDGWPHAFYNDATQQMDDDGPAKEEVRVKLGFVRLAADDAMPDLCGPCQAVLLLAVIEQELVPGVKLGDDTPVDGQPDDTQDRSEQLARDLVDLLDGKEHSADTLDAVVSCLRTYGFTIREPEDVGL